jgi:methionine synthase II (cobalamin-independent)
MYIQYSQSLPRIVTKEQKIIINTEGDLSEDLERFYTHYLSDNLDHFGLSKEYAEGFYTVSELINKFPGDWLKGHVTGPISLGLTITDQNLRASLYNELIADTLVKNTAMNARWQITELRKLRPKIIIFIDEPYMASFGSAFINISHQQVVDMLNEIFEAIHNEGGVAGVHCCANTDWSVLLDTTVDILNLDAYEYIENLSLYPEELFRFVSQNGIVAWGIVPTNEDAFEVDAQTLANRLLEGIDQICDKAQARAIPLTAQKLKEQSLLTPSCGLGSTSVEIAEKALSLLQETGVILKQTLDVP